LAAALGERSEEVERGGVGPLQILESKNNRLGSRACKNPGDERGQLTSPELFRRKGDLAARRQGDVDERRKQRRVFSRVEVDQPQSALKVGEALFGRSTRAKSEPPPFDNWMKRRVLQELRRGPFDPGVQRIRDARVELLKETRFA
jgi:hypothetical protein